MPSAARQTTISKYVGCQAFPAMTVFRSATPYRVSGNRPDRLPDRCRQHGVSLSRRTFLLRRAQRRVSAECVYSPYIGLRVRDADSARVSARIIGRPVVARFHDRAGQTEVGSYEFFGAVKASGERSAPMCIERSRAYALAHSLPRNSRHCGAATWDAIMKPFIRAVLVSVHIILR